MAKEHEHNEADEDEDDSDELPLDLTFDLQDAIGAKHSGAYIQKQNPRLFEGVQMLLDWGVPAKTIAKKLKMSRNAVVAIGRSSERPTLEHHKKVLLEALRRLSRGATERLIEIVESGDDIPAQALAVIMGISIEKEQLLSGGATARVERPVDPELLEFQRALMSGMGMVLPGANPAQKPDAREVFDLAEPRVIEALDDDGKPSNNEQ